MVALAEQFEVRPAYILNAAVNLYRISLHENADDTSSAKH
jgi:hypothetical protein